LGKLFNLKEWLTVPEAAKHLSNICAEEVSEADVLRLALDGHLKLSVNFVNHTKARRGRPIPFTMEEYIQAVSSGEYPDDLKWHFGDGTLAKKLNPHLTDEEARKADVFPLSLNLDDKRFLTLEDQIITLRGIWDLPMIGAERLDIEHQYQFLTGGPDITLCQFDGTTLVESEDGLYMCQLQEDFDDNEFEPGSLARLNVIKSKIINEDIEKEEGDRLQEEHKNRRKAFLEHQKENREAGKEINNYYPANGLPRDSVLVIRTSALRKFEQSIIADAAKSEKPLTAKERNSLLTIIAAICHRAEINLNERGIAVRIAEMTQDIGASVDEDTVRDCLKKIPGALESRQK